MGKKWLIAALVGIPLIFVAGMIHWFLHPQLTLTLEDLMEAEYSGNDVTTEVTEITDSACGAEIGCVNHPPRVCPLYVHSIRFC